MLMASAQSELAQQKSKAKQMTAEVKQPQENVGQQLRIFGLQQEEERKLTAAHAQAKRVNFQQHGSQSAV